jgi:hypothetical protein
METDPVSEICVLFGILDDNVQKAKCNVPPSEAVRNDVTDQSGNCRTCGLAGERREGISYCVTSTQAHLVPRNISHSVQVTSQHLWGMILPASLICRVTDFQLK